MSIKLIASDLDGTISCENNNISELNFKAIDLINNQNIELAICTGKSYSISKDLCKKCHAKYGIFNNGSQIYDLSTNRLIYNSNLTIDDIKKCYKLAKDNNLHVHCYADNQLITEKLEYLDLRNFKLQQYPGFKFIVVENVYNYIEKNNVLVQQLIISSLHDLDSFSSQILGCTDVTVSKISKTGKYKDTILNKEYEYISILPKNTSKSHAIEFLQNYLSIQKDEIMAIGDNINDIDMLQNSGISIAVANAYSDLKNVAKYITQNDVSEGGFAEAVFKFTPQK
jgi:Cof subfamily protein (haloacid dehalogenase superfamily)